MPPTPLNLKQRLTALSLAPSSPSTPLGTDNFPRSTLSPKRKKFALNWGKRSATDPALDEEQQALDRVQDVMSKLIFQAGVDFE
jgi:Rho GTPase-activating protein 1